MLLKIIAQFRKLIFDKQLCVLKLKISIEKYNNYFNIQNKWIIKISSQEVSPSIKKYIQKDDAEESFQSKSVWKIDNSTKSVHEDVVKRRWGV